jgi:hypothetical protein
LNPLPQGLFIPRNLKSIFIQSSVTQVSDVAHGPLVILDIVKVISYLRILVSVYWMFEQVQRYCPRIS